MFGLGMQEVLVIALIILLLFGGKKIPELMKGLGKGVKSFKDGMNGLDEESEKQPNADKNSKVANGVEETTSNRSDTK